MFFHEGKKRIYIQESRRSSFKEKTATYLKKFIIKMQKIPKLNSEFQSKISFKKCSSVYARKDIS